MLISALFLTSCGKLLSLFEMSQPQSFYTNVFAYNMMGGYYLWSEEISQGLEKWSFTDDPVKTVKNLRYKDAAGNDIDKWTTLMEDCSPFMVSVSGNGKTFGFEFIVQYADPSHKNVCAVVTFTYEGSPARKAGLKRGDVILTIDGTSLTPDNYYSILTEKIFDNATSVELGLYSGTSISLSAVEMYSNPVNVVKILDEGGKKVAYLHFSGFTWDAAEDLIKAFRTFKDQGVEDLVLDLRYNTGGYTTTCQVLASLIAPEAVVKEGAVFNRNIFNKNLTDKMEQDECFATEYTFQTDGGDVTFKPGEANLSLPRLWVITTGQSASASESLICGLKPYMDVTLVGTTTYGKFCGGYLIKAEDWYNAIAESKESSINAQEGLSMTAGWGIYIITSRYADCNGVTLSMPSGIPADYEVLDNPVDGFDLGDPDESMLSAVLSLMEGHPVTAVAARAGGVAAASGGAAVEQLPFNKPGSGAFLW